MTFRGKQALRKQNYDGTSSALANLSIKTLNINKQSSSSTSLSRDATEVRTTKNIGGISVADERDVVNYPISGKSKLTSQSSNAYDSGTSSSHRPGSTSNKLKPIDSNWSQSQASSAMNIKPLRSPTLVPLTNIRQFPSEMIRGGLEDQGKHRLDTSKFSKSGTGHGSEVRKEPDCWSPRYNQKGYEDDVYDDDFESEDWLLKVPGMVDSPHDYHPDHPLRAHQRSRYLCNHICSKTCMSPCNHTCTCSICNKSKYLTNSSTSSSDTTIASDITHSPSHVYPRETGLDNLLHSSSRSNASSRKNSGTSIGTSNSGYSLDAYASDKFSPSRVKHPSHDEKRSQYNHK